MLPNPCPHCGQKHLHLESDRGGKCVALKCLCGYIAKYFDRKGVSICGRPPTLLERGKYQRKAWSCVDQFQGYRFAMPVEVD